MYETTRRKHQRFLGQVPRSAAEARRELRRSGAGKRHTALLQQGRSQEVRRTESRYVACVESRARLGPPWLEADECLSSPFCNVLESALSQRPAARRLTTLRWGILGMLSRPAAIHGYVVCAPLHRLCLVSRLCQAVSAPAALRGELLIDYRLHTGPGLRQGAPSGR